MGDWYSLNPNQLIPPAVLAAAQGVAELVSAAASAATQALSISVPLPPIPTLPDPVPAVAQALITALQAITQGVKMNLLVVPIQKTYPAQPPPLLPVTTTDLQNWLSTSVPVSSSSASAYQSLISASASMSGGNAGFYQTFASSLLSMTDPNQPSFTQATDAITAAILMVGGPSFYGMTQAASGLNQLIRPKTDLTARTIPVPTDVTAVAVAAPSNYGDAPVGVQVNWSQPQATYSPQYFPGVTFTVNRYAVIKSTDASMRTARSVLDLFPTQALTEGMTSGPATVVAVGTGANSSYLDYDPETDDTVPLYYAVAWEINILEQQLVGVTTTTSGFDKLSAVVKVDPSAPSQPATGAQTSWGSVNSGQDLFPAVGQMTAQLTAQSQNLIAGTPSPQTRMQGAITVAQAGTTALQAEATALLAQVTNLQAALQRPLPSMYVTQITGTGGNAFLMTELARRLQEMSDPNRPPFDHGEYVCGIAVVAGGPNMAAIQNAIALLEALFGPATPANPLVALLSAIETTVTNAEAVQFGPNMQPLPAGTAPTVAPVLPVINAAGMPVATDDPSNPNIDFTNDTPIESLC